MNTAQNQPDYDGPSSAEDIKAFQYTRNMTGVVGDSKWHEDVKVNELWDKLSVPESNGNCDKKEEAYLFFVFSFIFRC